MRKLVVLLVLAVLSAACMPKLPDLPEVPTLGQTVLPVAAEENTMWISENHNGKPVLVVFMGSWCPWCKKSLTALDKTTAAYDGKVEVVGVFIDEDPALVEKVQKEYNIKSKVLYNGNAAAQELGVQGFPHIVLFDKKHKVAKVWSGFSPDLADQYAAEIDKLLK